MDTFSGAKPQPYTDNLKCVCDGDDDLLGAAGFTDRFFKSVEQTPSPSKCVLLRASLLARCLMRDLSDSGDTWSVKPDVQGVC